MSRVSKDTPLGVTIPKSHTGSSFFHHILQSTVDTYPEVFKGFGLPILKEFKKKYAESMVQFEAHRASSTKRTDIADYMMRLLHDEMIYRSENGQETPLSSYMKQAGNVITTKTLKLTGKAGYRPSVPFRGRYYQGNELRDLSHLLLQEHKMTLKTSVSLNWLAEFLKKHGNKINLEGRKFVVMGASAEIAPTSFLLAAGASVLWLDVKGADDILKYRESLAGELVLPARPCDLLIEPLDIAATIREFAGEDSIDLGLYAYAGGKGRELRLATAMNHITANLPSKMVRSVSMFVSPTSAAIMQPEDIFQSEEQRHNPPIWQAALKFAGQLQNSSSFTKDGTAIARAIVPIQGVSYFASQYLAKTLAAEVFSERGTNPNEPLNPDLRVSANVAGITKTQSLRHPIFQAAFLGAKTFGVEIFEVTTTKELAALLNFHDLLNEDTWSKDELFSKQIHGGIYSKAYALDPMIKIATVLGLVRKPKLLFDLF
ncbi:MAG: hypothetical protein HRU19_02470 [Pseudobacteriovorax sp.]|nr:hypothetical protein [Pseudobacteriovorax sp.]